ncbi:MAG TPA: APC family permease [Gemmatimonadales bacterium]|nr:APC family permease [Gemmatimonadales bacterium]
MTQAALRRALSGLDYFSFGFGSMVGVGWLVVMGDWLGRGGPAGAVLAFTAGGLCLLPVARVYGALVRELPDASGEVAYTEGVLPPVVSFGAGWVMVLAYAIVCPWEAVAIGNLLARLIPGINHVALYNVAGRTIYAPRLAVGVCLTGLIGYINYRGIRSSGRLQTATTIGLLACVAVFVALGLLRGNPAGLPPLFARPGTGGAFVSTLLVLQIVPYFMTGFESIGKAAEEARPGFDPSSFGRAMTQAVVGAAVFYVVVIIATALVSPWHELVDQRLGPDTVFARAFGSTAIARLIIAGALLSLIKVFNGNFVAATRLLFALGRRNLAPQALGRVHPRFGTPAVAVTSLALVTVLAACLGDAVLIPITEVGSLAAGLGWCAACIALIVRRRRAGKTAWFGIVGTTVSVAIVVMKLLPSIPGSFSAAEWIAFAVWIGLGAFVWFGNSYERSSGGGAGTPRRGGARPEQ